ncbi:MAG TPA: tRNA pseudouridine(55) synthase TruB [Oceanospirillales bacterium]|nr:tRNA pseudouridine(55) synthase TruB [Oceanospirillales bacterium]
MSQAKGALKWQDVHGILLFDKPSGMSSNLALQKVRRILNAKKAGHTGSLDPMATGLLPCCFGDATKVAGLMLNADKTYIAQCLIGQQTDTGDATGELVSTSTKKQLTETEILTAIEKLTGKIKQIPPMYSALHHNGQRLYKLARAGIEVERKARDITIHSFKLLSNDCSDGKQLLSFEIKVSKGTYIRTLIEDFAKACQSCAHLTRLRRTELGILKGQMITLSELTDAESPHTYLQNMDLALSEYKAIELDAKQVQTLIHGLRLKLNLPAKTYRLYDQKQKFLGMGISQTDGQFKVKNLFLKSYLS